MAESLGNDAAVRERIDAKIEKIRKFENELRCLITDRNELLTKSASANEIEISLTNELKLLHNTKEALRLQIEAERKLVDDKREQVEKTKSAKARSEKKRVDQLKSFENRVANIAPKFREALIVYNDDNLLKEIQQIREEGRNVRNEISKVNQEMETLVSQYELNQNGIIAIPKNTESAITELQELKAIWSNSNSERVSARERAESLSQEMKKKMERNKREIANLTY